MLKRPPSASNVDPSPSIDHLQRGLNLLFAAEVTRDVFEAVDVQTLQTDGPIEEAVDVKKLAGALGQPVGRLVAGGAARGILGGGLAGVLAREVGGRAGAHLCRTALERTDPEAIRAILRGEPPRYDYAEQRYHTSSYAPRSLDDHLDSPATDDEDSAGNGGR